MIERLVQVVYRQYTKEQLEHDLEYASNHILPARGRYAYRSFLELNVGDLVEVPPTVRTSFRGPNIICTVVQTKDVVYEGPTHAIIKKHIHRYIPQPKLCRCGKEHE